MLSRAGAFGLPLPAVVLWGGMFFVMASALPAVDAVHLQAIRYLVSAVVLTALLLATQGPRALRTHG